MVKKEQCACHLLWLVGLGLGLGLRPGNAFFPSHKCGEHLCLSWFVSVRRIAYEYSIDDNLNMDRGELSLSQIRIGIERIVSRFSEEVTSFNQRYGIQFVQLHM